MGLLHHVWTHDAGAHKALAPLGRAWVEGPETVTSPATMPQPSMLSLIHNAAALAAAFAVVELEFRLCSVPCSRAGPVTRADVETRRICVWMCLRWQSVRDVLVFSVLDVVIFFCTTV